MVHRDIKPSNVLLRKDGTALLADLGLARAMDEAAESGITRAGYTVGTVDFMPPEQARSSRAADARSDIYSLGCLWFYVLTGRIPFPEGDLTNKLRAHAVTPPPDPREFNSTVPAGVVAVLHRMLAKSPNERYASAVELLNELELPSLRRETFTSDDMEALALSGSKPSAVMAAEVAGGGYELFDSVEDRLAGSTQESRLPAASEPTGFPPTTSEPATRKRDSRPSLDALSDHDEPTDTDVPAAEGKAAGEKSRSKSRKHQSRDRRPSHAAAPAERAVKAPEPDQEISGARTVVKPPRSTASMSIPARRSGVRVTKPTTNGERILVGVLLVIIAVAVGISIWFLNKLDMYLIG